MCAQHVCDFLPDDITARIRKKNSVVSYLGGAMLAAVRVEVRSRGHAPVRVVTEQNHENKSLNASLVDPDPH